MRNKRSLQRLSTALVSASLAILLAMSFLFFGAFGVATVGAAHVAPTFVSGNATCGELVPGTTELKIEPVADGTFTSGALTVTIDVRDTADGQVFDFTSNIGVDAVFVKGGPGGNLYVYDPESTGDTDLHAPVNPSNNQFFGLSHISFCFDVEETTTTTTATTEVTTETTVVTEVTTETTAVTEVTTVTTTTVAGVEVTTEVVVPQTVTEVVAGVQVQALPQAGGLPLLPAALAILGGLLFGGGVLLRRFIR